MIISCEKTRFLVIFIFNLHSSISHPINKKEENPKERLYAKLFFYAVSKHIDLGAPSADAVGDATQGLEIGPFRELVVFGCGCDVCANHADGEVGDVGEGDLGAVELGGNG